MLYVYLVASAALLPILNNFFNVFGSPNSWWLVPLLFIGFFLGFAIIHLGLLFLAFALIRKNSQPEKGARFYRFIIKYSLPLLLWFARVDINLSGIEPDEISKDEKMLFVCNHQCVLDPIIMMAVFLDHDIGFIGKKDICTTMPFIAKCMAKLYGVFIDRENDREAAKSIIQAIRILKEEKASIGLFPEGYTSKTCELLPFRNGSFKIALKAKAPIVVCVLNNTRILPKRIFRRKTEVDFKIISVIRPEEYEGMNTTELGDMIHEMMEKSYNEIRNKA